MYKIEQKSYGVKLTFGGFLREAEMKSWESEMLSLIDKLPESFGLLADMRKMEAMPAKSQEILMNTQKKIKSRVIRSASITNSVITDIQSKRIGSKSGVNETKKFINAIETTDWEEKAIDWIENGVDPNA